MFILTPLKDTECVLYKVYILNDIECVLYKHVLYRMSSRAASVIIYQAVFFGSTVIVLVRAFA
jgi:hypothetical protein